MLEWDVVGLGPVDFKYPAEYGGAILSEGVQTVAPVGIIYSEGCGGIILVEGVFMVPSVGVEYAEGALSEGTTFPEDVLKVGAVGVG